jgi:hypothetical protein
MKSKYIIKNNNNMHVLKKNKEKNGELFADKYLSFLLLFISFLIQTCPRLSQSLVALHAS